ncbi:MAG: hypothetical protein U0132_13525 [Gemmatimonadaceae bacterium]
MPSPAKWVRSIIIAGLPAVVACRDSTSTQLAQLPFVTESGSTRYFYEPGDVVDTTRQEAFNRWALARLPITLPTKIEYRKYRSRAAMAHYTGNGNTNGYAEPPSFRIHTIWPWDNHEVVHVYSAVVGRPSDFFNEGLAVSFQTDPAHQDFSVRFNGVQVHEACRAYRRAGTLPSPLRLYVTTAGFRGITDQIMSYRMAGSFVLFLQEQYGLPRVLAFFQDGSRDDTLTQIQSRFQVVFGKELDAAEADWLATIQ